MSQEIYGTIGILLVVVLLSVILFPKKSYDIEIEINEDDMFEDLSQGGIPERITSDKPHNERMAAAQLVLSALFPNDGLFFLAIIKDEDTSQGHSFTNMESKEAGMILRRVGLSLLGAKEPANEDAP